VIALNGSALRSALVKGLPDAMTPQHRSRRTALHSPLLSRRLPTRLQRCGSEIRVIGATAHHESYLRSARLNPNIVEALLEGAAPIETHVV
jgi:hypothetical protein